MKRTLYIGDVHGCAYELESIIDAFGFVEGSDSLYQTGDIINKGPDMLRCFSLIEKFGIKTVRGNHEEHLIHMIESDESSWTEKQKQRFARLPMNDWQYIYQTVKKWPLYRDTPFALLVHAGLEPGKKNLDEMSPKVLLSIREWNGKPWFEQVSWEKTVIFGHWAKMGLVQKPNFIGLDSGCVYGKALSAYCPEEDKFYSIPAKRVYSPVKKSIETATEAPCLFPEERKESSSESAYYREINVLAPDLIKEWGNSVG